MVETVQLSTWSVCWFPKITSSCLQVFSEQYFLVTMDNLIEESEGAGRSFLCHRDSPGIFPTQWSLKNGLALSPPPGLFCQTFSLHSSLLELIL